MTINENTITTLGKAIKYLKNIPEGTYFSFGYDGGLHLEGQTQEDVKKLRRAFRGVIWKKEYREWLQSWQYSGTTRSGVKLLITGVTEGPPACKMIEETVLEERSVPVTYEKKMVEIKRVKYICPDGNKVRD